MTPVQVGRSVDSESTLTCSPAWDSVPASWDGVTIGPYEFDHVTYDALGDLLYLRAGESPPPQTHLAHPRGHAVRFDEDGNVIGITIVNAKWLLERGGMISVTVPEVIETSADELAPALRAS